MIKRRPVFFFMIVFLSASAVLTAVTAIRFEVTVLFAWLLGANLVAFALWGFDKLQARRSGWRVPETALHLMSLLGATPAALIGMKLFRHKTMKMHFKLTYAVLLLVQIAVVITLARSGETP